MAQQVTYYLGDNFEVGFYNAGGDFLDMPDVGGFTTTGAEADVIEIASFGGYERIVGRRKAPTITFDVPKSSPLTEAHEFLEDSLVSEVPDQNIKSVKVY